jgi:fermentation-respiration switch protein FrsA (DUF1100 family)
LSSNLSFWSKLPDFPFTPLILALIPYTTGTDVDAVMPIHAVEKIYPRPILFVHGTGDRAIPHINSIEMAKTHEDRFELWITEGSKHVGSYAAYPEAYVEKVDLFFRRSMNSK